jgi:hypothetical protein
MKGMKGDKKIAGKEELLETTFGFLPTAQAGSACLSGNPQSAIRNPQLLYPLYPLHPC